MLQSNLHHSIIFGDGTMVNGQFTGYDTWDDWHLIPTSRPTIAMPGVEMKFVTIPGMDGTIDLSNFIRGDRPAFGTRSGTFEFYVVNPYDDFTQYDYWMTVYPKIVNALHGKQFKMVLREDDPDYFWEGRFTVDKYEPGDGNHSTVAISYQVGPYKWKIREGNDAFTWDNFNFEKDYDNHLEPGICYANNGVIRADITNASSNTVLHFASRGIHISPRKTATIILPVPGKRSIWLAGSGNLIWREGSL